MRYNPEENGPFYHGTKAELQVGDFLSAGHRSNYRPNVIMNHIYFTALKDGASLAAALARGEGEEHVYEVEPTGEFEDDPNVTDKKFPGNPTRSYRSTHPLKIVAEITDYKRLTDEERKLWKERLKAGEQRDEDIINYPNQNGYLRSNS
ncbi:rifampin ADP-ribosyl transferase [Listeria floridensis FSL S10-1187]|uniref:Rifampin ADP-ribosyl transferase n=1 Tax=Listeria floridensis FSL S10-1187 TaxID=1265817 RepID=A0ABN0RG15_9LIST|nr:NAD(+)--rifampin ADP-ribosyltransferase [Listeria floridensis]EUJ32757.1 rifampin ADP-ribosyl transferase [Listeria floridensis FSL S10-1187]